MTIDLTALIERVEQAVGPDREIDLLIAQYVGRVPVGATYDFLESMAWHNRSAYALPAYTASYDAAVSLVPKGWIVKTYRGFNGDGEYYSSVSLTDSFTVDRGCDPDDEVTVTVRLVERTQGVDPTPLAVTSASLRTRESE